MAFKFAARLRRSRHGILYIRIVVPQDVRRVVGQAEIQKSLKTASIRLAEPLALALTNAAWRTFDKIRSRSMSNDSKPLTDLEKLLNADPNIRAKINAAGQRVSLALKDAEIARLDHEREQVDFAHAAQVAALNAVILQDKAPRGKSQEGSSLTLVDAFESFCQEKVSRGRWKPKTELKYRLAFKLFTSFFEEARGSIPLPREVRRQDVLAYLDVLRKLPPNIGRDYSAKSLAEIVALGRTPMSSSSVNDNLGLLSGLFIWCASQPEFEVVHNPCARLTIKQTKQRELRAFTDDELRKLLATPNFAKRHFFHPFQYWLIPLGLLTGARLGELCQLRLDDFVQVGGHWCIQIQEGEGQSVKNENATRLVPLHPRLLQVGLVDYVDALRMRGETRLFPEINMTHGPSHTASKWFGDKNRYSDRAGVGGSDTNFHSFRRAFITRALKSVTNPQGAELREVQAVVGHEMTGGVTTNTYLDRQADVKSRVATVSNLAVDQAILELIPEFRDVRIG